MKTKEGRKERREEAKHKGPVRSIKKITLNLTKFLRLSGVTFIKFCI